MTIESILSPERTHCGISASSKKRALEEITVKLAGTTPGVEAEELFDKLINREKMGTTAIGNGIAIPHCRLEGCEEITGGLFTLEHPVDFEAFDDRPVSVLFVLLVPAEEVDEHLQVLAMLAKRFESASYRESLISANHDGELYQVAIADLVSEVKQARS
ncbi:MAG TPA: PTS sugar transporter subunit IIA [Pseudomonadales bacterium]|nr:PTS fructose transporter subunit IIA [Gammaproteobacteria bacterium]MDP6026749.1 PTS sugar transporter subunit IIA [Pseudomonadales bacterium]MDP6316020.1 PTS sugar transporter subunit IIA [Pseudomonadales bacterium]MDP7313984.1 PTS sugar transporter subunit IIA [Pseudomonadales bacterium]HJL60780.1 PTS sugar transporter subunit IIA [Pseudomonadales bacterium]